VPLGLIGWTLTLSDDLPFPLQLQLKIRPKQIRTNDLIYPHLENLQMRDR